MKKPIVVAIVLAVVALLWIGSGQIGALKHQAAQAPATEIKGPPPRPQVRVAHLTAQPRERFVVVSGRTEASRAVDVRVQVDGRVVEVLVEKGAAVKAGDPILKLAVDERKARLDESKALQRQREIEYGAARDLQQKGFRSETSLAQAQAQLDAARSIVQRMEIELANTIIKAPFDGTVGHDRAELGNFLRIGDKAANIVDLHPLLIVGYLAEREISPIALGAHGQARLLDGTVADGEIVYIAPQADPVTRTYRIELMTANADGRIRAGLTCEISIPVASALAHVLSPAVLSLADNGTIGVKIVNAANVVEFRPIEVLGETNEGLWVTGLPPEVTLITVGGDFVVAGQTVEPIALPLPGPGGA